LTALFPECPAAGHVLFGLLPPGDPRPPVRLVEGDAIDAAGLLPAAAADLAYLDPPFATGTRFDCDVPVAGVRVRRPAFRDGHRGRPEAYLGFLAPRLEAALRLLRPGASLYVHLDWRAAPYARLHLDRLLGVESLRNEIVWRRNPPLGRKARAGQFGRVTDTILFYTLPGAPPTFHPQSILRPAARGSYRTDGTGRAFRTAPRGDYTDRSIERLETEGRVHRTRSGAVRIRYDLLPSDRTHPDGSPVWMERFPVDSLWTDVPDAMHLPPAERTGYPTQKPRLLLDRVVAASSNPGDTVIDLLCGSGTALAAAVDAGRRAAGCDASPAAIDAAFARLAAAGHPVVVERPGPVPADVSSATREAALRVERRGNALAVVSYVPSGVPDWPGAAEAVRAAEREKGLPLLAGWGPAEAAPDGSVRLHAWIPADAESAEAPIPEGGRGGRTVVMAIDRFGSRVCVPIRWER
jgi:DNA modification methylase